MRVNNLRSQALLSVNPSFNMNFIDEQVFTRSYMVENLLTEIKNEKESKEEKQHSRKIKYRNEKSEPSVGQSSQ